jgi:hypothetical protein
MHGDGCILVLAFFVLPLGVIFWAVIHSAKVERARKYERGARLTNLLVQFDKTSDLGSVRQELSALLAAPPVGVVENFMATGGWFELAIPALNRLSQSSEDAFLLEGYFRAFTFCGGQQAKVLQFLFSMLSEAMTKSRQQELFKSLASHVLVSSSPAEARWLYDRALELLRAQNGSTGSKDLALYVGRHAYSAGRPGRRPTVYDEQAIANDIAARVR